MMEENRELKAGRVYDLDMDGRDFGRCLYLGKRRGNGIVYNNVLARRNTGYIFMLFFSDYSLEGDRLAPIKKRSYSPSLAEEEYLEKVLSKAGL